MVLSLNTRMISELCIVWFGVAGCEQMFVIMSNYHDDRQNTTQNDISSSLQRDTMSFSI